MIIVVVPTIRFTDISTIVKQNQEVRFQMFD